MAVNIVAKDNKETLGARPSRGWLVATPGVFAMFARQALLSPPYCYPYLYWRRW